MAATRRRQRYKGQRVSSYRDLPAGPVASVPTADIEAAVVYQVLPLLRQLKIVDGLWRATHRQAPDLTEVETKFTLHRLEPTGTAFPVKQARILRLAQSGAVGPVAADTRLKLNSLGGNTCERTAVCKATLTAVAGAAALEA